MVQTWEKYDAMLTLEKRSYTHTLDLIYNCERNDLKLLYRKKLKLSKDIIRALKLLVKDLDEMEAFRNMKRINKSLKRLESYLRNQVELAKEIDNILQVEKEEFNNMMDGVVDDLGITPVTAIDDDTFVEV